MKYIGVLFFCLAFFTMQGQGIAPKVAIDTIHFSYNFIDAETYEVAYPQLRVEGHDYAASLINADIKTYFANDTLSIYNVALKEGATIEDLIAGRKELQGPAAPYHPDEFNQSFEVTFQGDNVISILVSENVFPTGGHIMFSSYGLQYSLLSGKKMLIDDFLSISNQQLTNAIVQHGYWYDQEESQVVKREIDREGFKLDEHIASLLSKEVDSSGCTHFYFKKEGSDINLMLRLECAGPTPIDIGVSLEYLKPYITYYEFKNRYKLWGTDISKLIGKEMSPSKTGPNIVFDSSAIVEGGGYIIGDNDGTSKNIYAISYWHSAVENLYLFTVKKPGAENFVVTDILSIAHQDVVKYRVIDAYCETTEGGDPEIIALVKDRKNNHEYYTKIVKAWRANRNTGKFEPVKPKKVKRCGNEGYGGDE